MMMRLEFIMPLVSQELWERAERSGNKNYSEEATPELKETKEFEM